MAAAVLCRRHRKELIMKRTVAHYDSSTVMNTSIAKRPPGPKHLLGFSFIQKFRAAPLALMDELHRNYGDIVYTRMGPYHTFFFFHPDQIREILVDKSKLLPKFRLPVRVLQQWDGNGLLLSEGEFWARQRRLVQPAFHLKRFAGYADAMVQKSESLAQVWEKLPDSSVIDVEEAMTALTLEIIGKTFFDADLGEETQNLRKAVAILSETAVREMGEVIHLPDWIPLPRISAKKWAMNYLDSTIRRFIADRRKTGEDRGDLLSMLLHAVDSEDSTTQMTDEQARDEAMVLFLAGHDTTAAGLTWFWYVMGKYPEIQQRAHNEIVSVLGKNSPGFADAMMLPYLNSVIKETLRLYPPAVGILAREAKEQIELGGFEIPLGSIIYAFSYITHRDQRWFPEPERFDPERFMGDNGKNVSPFAYFPFGGGPRSCIGSHFALTEMTLVAACLLQRFEFSLRPGDKDFEPAALLSLRPKGGLSMILRKR
jgi:cytochrome P450